MSNHGITRDNLYGSFPIALATDEKLNALALSIATLLAERVNEINRVKIYTSIDDLPEELLDILAKDFKVDWWSSTFSLEEKRNTLKTAWKVHRLLGTKKAVSDALNAIYPDTEVSEWFEYGGDPYHFKLMIDASYQQVDPVKHDMVLKNLAFYKNARSVLDEVEYIDSCSCDEYVYAGCSGMAIIDGATAI